MTSDGVLSGVTLKERRRVKKRFVFVGVLVAFIVVVGWRHTTDEAFVSTSAKSNNDPTPLEPKAIPSSEPSRRAEATVRKLENELTQLRFTFEAIGSPQKPSGEATTNANAAATTAADDDTGAKVTSVPGAALGQRPQAPATSAPSSAPTSASTAGEPGAPYT